MSAGAVGSGAVGLPDEGLSVELALGFGVGESDDSVGDGLEGGSDDDGEVALPDGAGAGLGGNAGGETVAVLPVITGTGCPLPT